MTDVFLFPEEAKLQLISDYENDSAHKTQVELLSVDITKLQTEVTNVNLLLNKEKAKNRSVNKHSEVSSNVSDNC